MHRQGSRILLALLLVVLVCCPVSPAAGFVAEDSFSAYWLVRTPGVRNRVEAPACLHYRVRRGDTLWKLGRLWGVRPEAIAAASRVPVTAVINPGQQLVIPVSCLTHQVQPGDTLWSLARRYRVSLARLMAGNGISDPAGLEVGAELVIPGVAVTPATDHQEAEVLARGENGGFTWPLSGEVTSFYGPRNGEFHHGLDIAGNYGAIIRAAARGVVSSVERRPVYGNTVVLDHGSGVQTWYGHVEEYLVRPGETVNRGQPIARVGASGNATGPHLHFEVREHDRAVDPFLYLNRL